MTQAHTLLQRGIRTLVALGILTATSVQAHMPWLASDDQGHAILWFGESPDDRTYHMPKNVAAIELQQGESKSALKTRSVDSDSFVGMQSTSGIDAGQEVFGTVTYGLYHGTKLTYHVEHLPQQDSTSWPTSARSDAPLQTIISPSPAGGVIVTVLQNGEPLQGIDVKLFCEDGHEEAALKTDATGLVTFDAKDVETGLNAVLVSVTDGNAQGELNGEAYQSTSDFLTATFFKAGKTKKKKMKTDQNAGLDPNSGASVVPSGLADLPEELTSFGAAIAGKTLYVYGGHTGDAHSYSKAEQSDRLWSLDLGAGKAAKWQERPGGPTLQGLALVAHGQHVIRIGGFTAVNELGEEHQLVSQSSVVRFDPATDQWTEMPSLPEPRSSLDAAVLDDTLYVFGGWQLDGKSDNSQWHTTAWSLDLADDSAKWEPVATPPFQRRAISVAAHNGKLFVVGGMQEKGGPTTRVDVYDPAKDAWSEGPSVPGSGMSGFGSSSFACGGHLYVSTMDGFVHQLNSDASGWSTVAKIDPARFFHRMLPISDHELVVIGGANMEIGKFTQIETIRLPKP